jgi:hypothetical protein
MLQKIGSLPETQVSAMKEVYRRGLGQYTDLGTPLPEMFAAIKVDLTRHIRDFVPILQEEARYGFEKLIKFEDTQQWISAPAFKTSKRLVAMLNARAFIGPPLSRETSWVDAMYNYSDDLKQTFLTLERFPTWTWTLLHPFLFNLLHINKRRKIIEEKLRPIVAQDLRHDIEGGRQKVKLSEQEYQIPGRLGPQKVLFNWVRERLGGQKADDIKLLARIQLRAALAGMDTVSHALTNVIYDLAAYPEYVEPLREEIVSVIGTAKVWSMPAMEKLDKLDSFIKESMRMNPMYLREPSSEVYY